MGAQTLPDRIGPYTIRAELGRGAMGIVYEAEQDEPRRVVALKVLRGGTVADAHDQALFRREIRALARLGHPGIATLYASGQTPDGLSYFAMERVAGVPLDNWLRHNRIDVKARLRLFLEIAKAVAYAHERGVYHRDLKPTNVLVSGDPPAATVLDFGLARIVEGDRAAGSAATEFGTVRGTLEYMSPEQLAGDPDVVDGRADVYALGVMLYEMLLGEHPLDLRDAPAFDVPRRILEQPPKSIARRLDADLSTVVLKALEKDPDRRYSGVKAYSDDVERYLAGEPIAARPPSAAYQFRKLVLRHKGPFAALATGVVFLAAFGISMAVLATRLATERDRANAEAAAARSNAAAFTQVLGKRVTGFGYRRLDDPAGVVATVDEIDAQWTGDPVHKVELLSSAGLAVFDAGSREAGIRLLERAVAISRESDPNWQASGTAQSLGEMYVQAGRPADALPLFQGILDRLHSWPQPVTPRAIGYSEENLGTALRDLGRLDEAELHLREALRAYESEKFPNPEYLASAHDSLGNLALAKNDLAAAEHEHRAAFSLREQTELPDSPKTLRSAHFVGLVLAREGRRAEAEPILRHVLAKREAILGPDHPDTVATRETLALCSSSEEVALHR
jgi:eukaryotic-like serine/threonine-protein kinase